MKLVVNDYIVHKYMWALYSIYLELVVGTKMKFGFAFTILVTLSAIYATVILANPLGHYIDHLYVDVISADPQKLGITL